MCAALNARVQRDEAAEKGWAEQTITRALVRLPIDEHLSPPQACAGRFLMIAEAGRDRGVRVFKGSFDPLQK